MKKHASGNSSKVRPSAHKSVANAQGEAAHFSALERRRFQSALLKWYDKNGRQLPWRASSDPYRVWLSEIMLQQTTVAAVVPYFERFLAAFPTVNDLATANEDQVLRLWEGLGYYSRARNLHRAAKVICDQHRGSFPSDVVQLHALPGVGRYTAGAIASFAFDIAAPIVEANTERLYARLIGLTDDVKSSAGQKSLWQFAESIVPLKRSGDANQALMDVGSSICTPQNPKCDACPLKDFCRAFSESTQASIPVRKPRVAVTEVDELAVVVLRQGEVLLRRRTADERWAGMWDFARFELSAHERQLVTDTTLMVPKHTGKSSTTSTSKSRSLFVSKNVALPDELQTPVAAQLGLTPTIVKASMEFKYSVTRYRVTLACLLCEANNAKLSTSTTPNDSLHWFKISQLPELPLSQTGRRIADWISKVCLKTKRP